MPVFSDVSSLISTLCSFLWRLTSSLVIASNSAAFGGSPLVSINFFFPFEFPILSVFFPWILLKKNPY